MKSMVLQSPVYRLGDLKPSNPRPKTLEPWTFYRWLPPGPPSALYKALMFPIKGLGFRGFRV